jgi:hypothetical protein
MRLTAGLARTLPACFLSDHQLREPATKREWRLRIRRERSTPARITLQQPWSSRAGDCPERLRPGALPPSDARHGTLVLRTAPEERRKG